MRGLMLGIAARLPPPAATGETIPFPAALARIASDAGIGSAIVVERGTSESGLVDGSGDRTLHVPGVALDAARDDAERTALIAIALSYKVAPGTPGGLNGAGRLLSGIAAGYVEDAVEDRERRDPFLKLPTTPRRWEPAREVQSSNVDRRALRALAWAKTDRTCEAKMAWFLSRLARLDGAASAIGSDARRMREGLGLLRFAPDGNCQS